MIYPMETKKAEFFMMVGIPSSGKSYYSKQLVQNHRAMLFSSDTIRRLLKLDVTKAEDNQKLFDYIYKTMREALKRGWNIVFDATNIDRKRRMHFLHMIEDLNVEKICVVILRKYENCLITNTLRNGRVKEEIIHSMLLSYQIPYYTEGWDKIEVHYTDDDENSLGSPLRLVEEYMDVSHENPHHDETLGEHFRLVNEGLKNEDQFVRLAGQLHDVGKPLAKTYYNRKGEKTENAHYYRHENASAYLCMFYDMGDLTMDEKLYVAYLVNMHMRPFDWDNSEPTLEKDRAALPPKIIRDLQVIHMADLAATLKYEKEPL